MMMMVVMMMMMAAMRVRHRDNAVIAVMVVMMMVVVVLRDLFSALRSCRGYARVIHLQRIQCIGNWLKKFAITGRWHILCRFGNGGLCGAHCGQRSRGTQKPSFFGHLSMMGGMLFVVAFGAGAYSVDAVALIFHPYWTVKSGGNSQDGPPKADTAKRDHHVRFVPKADKLAANLCL
jgi:hypothetical protein